MRTLMVSRGWLPVSLHLEGPKNDAPHRCLGQACHSAGNEVGAERDLLLASRHRTAPVRESRQLSGRVGAGCGSSGTGACMLVRRQVSCTVL